MSLEIPAYSVTWAAGPAQRKIATVLLDPKWLAAALASYEADEPHIDTSRDPVVSDSYPPIDPDVWEDYLKEDHMGDCTNQPCPCVKCAAEMVRHKAEWVIEQASRRVSE